MLAIFDGLRELTLAAIFLRFTLACAFGGIIGFERGRRQQAAGLRTHMMVCLGAAATMLVGEYAVLHLQAVDMLRLGAQVVSGIGFLGAGTIIVTKQNRIRGLTTAASLWTSACMGLAIGSGFYECALVMMLAMLFILLVLGGLDVKYVKSPAHISIYLEIERNFEFSNILKHIKQDGWIVQEIRELSFLNTEYIALRVDLLSDERVKKPVLEMDDLYEIPQIHHVSRL